MRLPMSSHFYPSLILADGVKDYRNPHTGYAPNLVNKYYTWTKVTDIDKRTSLLSFVFKTAILCSIQVSIMHLSPKYNLGKKFCKYQLSNCDIDICKMLLRFCGWFHSFIVQFFHCWFQLRWHHLISFTTETLSVETKNRRCLIPTQDLRWWS